MDTSHIACPPAAGPSVLVELRGLLAAAARLPLDGRADWTGVRQEAAHVTARLAADGLVAPHLVVDRSDPPVLVARTLAVAWRHAAGR